MLSKELIEGRKMGRVPEGNCRPFFRWPAGPIHRQPLQGSNFDVEGFLPGYILIGHPHAGQVKSVVGNVKDLHMCSSTFQTPDESLMQAACNGNAECFTGEELQGSTCASLMQMQVWEAQRRGSQITLFQIFS